LLLFLELIHNVVKHILAIIVVGEVYSIVYGFEKTKIKEADKKKRFSKVR